MIVRELTTKLGFSFDRTNLDKFEHSILGFKTKTAITVGSIGIAFKKVVEYAQDFSDKILKTSALAKFSDTSIQELDALQSAFQKFDIPLETVQGFFENLSLGIKGAFRGENNQIQEIVKESRGAVQANVNGQLVTTKKFIEDLFAYIKTKSRESEQLRIITNAFGVDITTANAINNLIKSTNGDFSNLIDKEKQSLELLNSQVVAAKEFKMQINELNVEFEKLSATIAKTLVPFLSGTLQIVNKSVENFKKDYFETFLNDIGFSHSQEDQRDIAKQVYNGNTNSSNITNNNKFEFNVAPGTTEQQANFFTEAIKSTWDYLWNEKVREVNNNNPQVE